MIWRALAVGLMWALAFWAILRLCRSNREWCECERFLRPKRWNDFHSGWLSTPASKFPDRHWDFWFSVSPGEWLNTWQTETDYGGVTIDYEAGGKVVGRVVMINTIRKATQKAEPCQLSGRKITVREES